MWALTQRLWGFSFLLFHVCLGQTGNLFDFKNSLTFANYLYENGDFLDAAHEYERIVFMDSASAEHKLRLISAYRLGKDYQQAASTLKRFASISAQNPGGFAAERSKLFFQSGTWKLLPLKEEFLRGLSPDQRRMYRITYTLLQKNWPLAHSLSDSLSSDYPQQARLIDWSHASQKIRYKRPGIALGLSVVPGMGKIYAKQWRDGLISLVVVSLLGFQTVRIYQKEGIDHPLTWVYGGLATGYYGGNLYGSWQAAKRYNAIQEAAITDEVEAWLGTW